MSATLTFPAPAAFTPASRPDPAPLLNTLSVAIDASPAATLAALRKADPAGPLLRAAGAFDAADRLAMLPADVPAPAGAARSVGTILRVAGGPPIGHVPAPAFDGFSLDGHVKARWDIGVRAGAEGGSFLTVRTRFEATDPRSRGRLLDAWGLVGPLAATLSRRTALGVKAAAED